MSASNIWILDVELRGSERTAWQEGMSGEARNHSRVASALPHSEGIAYKLLLCGEIAMGLRVGRMRPIK
jgi:hypothetical protein